jgi:hypothetical protein
MTILVLNPIFDTGWSVKYNTSKVLRIAYYGEKIYQNIFSLGQTLYTLLCAGRCLVSSVSRIVNKPLHDIIRLIGVPDSCSISRACSFLLAPSQICEPKGQTCEDLGARTPISASGNYLIRQQIFKNGRQLLFYDCGGASCCVVRTV